MERGSRLIPVQSVDGGDASLVKDFLDHLRSKGYSAASLKTYFHQIRLFLKSMAGWHVERLQDVMLEHVERQRKILFDRKLSDNTVSTHVKSLRGLFNWLEREGVIFANPMDELICHRPTRRLGVIPTVKEMKSLLEQPDTTTLLGIRDRAILELLFGTGLRRVEIGSLTVLSVDLRSGSLRVMGKGKKERDAAIGRHTLFWLDKYMREARPKLLGKKLDEGNAPLWLSSKGAALSLKDISGMVRKHRTNAGMDKKVTPHSLRRAFATHMLNNGANVEHIRQMLGHSDMRSLRQYLGVTLDEMRKTHERSRLGR